MYSDNVWIPNRLSVFAYMCRKSVRILGVVLNIKETLSIFFSENCGMKGLLGDLSLMHQSWPRLGRDSMCVQVHGRGF